MRKRIRLAFTLIATTTLLALALTTSNASARSFSATERNFELIWSRALSGKTEFTFGDAAGVNIECNVTLLGRYAGSTIVKRTGINQGTINHGEVGTCTRGTFTIRTETMPWNLRYIGFTGTLPRIETIRAGLIGAFFRVREANGVECEFATEANHPIGWIIEGAGLENVRLDETTTIPLGGEFLCGFASPGHFSGRGLIRNLPNTANITITLI